MLRLQRPRSHIYAGQRESANIIWRLDPSGIDLAHRSQTLRHIHFMVRDFDDNEFPLAYLISFRTYGTWLHGDNRGSTSRKQNKYDTPRIAPNPRLQRAELKQLQHPTIKLDSRQRPVVEQAVREVCANRGYWLRAINVRTNHVHTVVSAAIKPEPILQAFQAYATRKLRRAGLLPEDVKPWTRHGSTPYLWKERHVERAIDYVVNGQGDELPSFDD